VRRPASAWWKSRSRSLTYQEIVVAALWRQLQHNTSLLDTASSRPHALRQGPTGASRRLESKRRASLMAARLPVCHGSTFYIQLQGAGLAVAPTPRSLATWKFRPRPVTGSAGLLDGRRSLRTGPGSASWCLAVSGTHSRKTTQRRNVVMSDVIHRSGSPPLAPLWIPAAAFRGRLSRV
jgi:hypothetical protein